MHLADPKVVDAKMNEWSYQITYMLQVAGRRT